MTGMFSNATLSTANYDGLIIGWSARSLQNGVIFDAGSSTYTQAVSTSATVRDVFTGTYSWNISDGGPVPQGLATFSANKPSLPLKIGINSDD